MKLDINNSSVFALRRWLAQNRRRLAKSGVVFIMATYRRRGDEGEFDDFRVLDCNGTEIYFNLGMSFLELMEALIHEPAPRGTSGVRAQRCASM